MVACCRNDSILEIQTHSSWQIAPGISLLHREASIQLLIYRHATYFIKWVYKLRTIKKNNICIHSHSLDSSTNVNGLKSCERSRLRGHSHDQVAQPDTLGLLQIAFCKHAWQQCLDMNELSQFFSCLWKIHTLLSIKVQLFYNFREKSFFL